MVSGGFSGCGGAWRELRMQPVLGWMEETGISDTTMV